MSESEDVKQVFYTRRDDVNHRIIIRFATLKKKCSFLVGDINEDCEETYEARALLGISPCVK